MDNQTAGNEANIEQSVETEVETTTAEPEVQEGLPEQEPKTETKGLSKAAKLLAQRNEARNEAEELKTRLSSLESRFEAEDDAKVQEIQNNFNASYGEDALTQATEMQNQHPSLSLEQAYQLAGGTLQKNPARFATPGRTPTALRTEKTVKDMSRDELRAAATEELRGMGIGG